MQLKSFAKINLCLYVLRKREDGFHDICTVMQAVALHDSLSLYKSRHGIVVQTDNPQLPTDRRNLAYRAAEIFLSQTGMSSGVKIRIQKRIPLSSGLGGGSSNAAFTLIGLNRLFKLGLTRKKLAQMAEQIGSDVPFFLSPGQAVATGRGERIREVKLPRDYWVVVVKPDVSLSTSWVYENFKIDLTKKKKSIKIYKKRESFFDSIVGWENELEKVSAEKYPQIKELREELAGIGAVKTSMSGSGAAVYGIFFDKPRHKEVKGLGARKWQVWVTRPIPLLVL